MPNVGFLPFSGSVLLDALQNLSPALIWELKELALNASCREAMGESAALSTLTALLAEEDLPDEAHVHAAGALKVCPEAL